MNVIFCINKYISNYFFYKDKFFIIFIIKMYHLFGIMMLCIIISIYIIYNGATTNGNLSRHMTNEFNYAHFSNITSKNYYLYPSLLLTNPYKVVLNEGECLWIPKKWWHWIRSSKSVAINFWSMEDFRGERYQLPCVFKNKLNNSIFSQQLDNYNDNIDIWNSETDKTYRSNMIDMDGNDKYLITVDGYSNKEKLNALLHNTLKDYIQIPDIFTDPVEKNIWISSGFHDTGLHYDDNYGLLTILSGTKTITLYPPSDTAYLHPICILPKWAKNTPVQFEYNIYKNIKNLDPLINFPSSRLLYESIILQNNKNILKYITNITQNLCENSLVWGCKLHNGIMRWEIYAYHYNHTDNRLSELSNSETQITTIKTYNESVNSNIIIHSYDLFNTSEPLQPDIHFYHKISNIELLPFFGYGTNIVNSNINDESKFVIDTQDNFIINYKEYTKKINFKNVSKFKKILNKYKCSHICIHKKNDTDIFIQFLGISITDFIQFLITFDYPTELIKHVNENKSLYFNICHEITIVYNILSKKPIRSAFYGIV